MDRYHIALIVLFIIFLISLGAYFNVLGLGAALAGLGGDIINGLAGFLTWGGAGGGPTVGVVYVSILVLGFLGGGLLMKGVNKLRGTQTQALPQYQAAPTTVIPITPLQSQPTPQPQPAPTAAPVAKKEETA